MSATDTVCKRELQVNELWHLANAVVPDHLIGTPKSLACEKMATESWTRFQDIPALKSPNFKIIQGSVSKVDCAAKVAHITDTTTKSTITEPYDYLIVASGLRRVYPTVPESLQRDDFLEEARKHAENVRNAQGVVIVGGGARFSSGIIFIFAFSD